MSPEVTGTVVRQESTLPRRDPVDIPVLANPHEIIAGLMHHVVSGAGHVLVVGGQSIPGGIANPLGLLSPGVVSGATRYTAPGRRTDRLCDPL